MAGCHDGEMVFLEVGNRVGGADVVATVELATGVHLPSFELGILLGEPVAGELPEPPVDRRRYGWFVFPGHHLAGRAFQGLDGAAALRASSRVVAWNELLAGTPMPDHITYQAGETVLTGIAAGDTPEDTRDWIINLFGTVSARTTATDLGTGLGMTTQHAGSPPPTTTALADLADRYVEEMAALDPCLAAVMGVAGQEDRLTDYGPQCEQARTELARRTLAALDDTALTGDAERVAAAMMRERLATEVTLAEADAYATMLDTIDGPIQRIRAAVGVLDQGPDTEWDALLARLRVLPETLAGLHTSLEAARHRGRVAPRRQVARNARECRDMRADLAGMPATPGDGALRRELEHAVAAATEALAGFAAYLSEKLAADAPERDAVGEDRYQLGVRQFLGTRLDLAEIYVWGWDELAWVRREMTDAAARIAPGEPVPTVLAALDRDPRYQVTGAAVFRDWIQELADGAIADLDGTHFTIPAPLRQVDCRIAPAGGPAHYLAPSEDLSRPGTVGWPLTDPDAPIPTWTVPSTMFHEGVPGHHLQLGMTTLNTVTLNRFQRLTSELHPGHCEGWGLYAERLMDELGYLADPAHRLGMLAMQQWRSARIVLDIGLHLELPIPAGSGFAEGQRWTPALGRAFLTEYCGLGPPEFVAFEIDRYLGRPGQAIAYKLGERVWLEAREEARRRDGAAFDLKRFHHNALDLGPMGLDLLHAELTRQV